MMTSDKYRKYEVDKVYSESVTNTEIYQDSIQQFVAKFLEGYNSSIFVYGQTGTGKSYTMGVLDDMSAESSGMIPSSIRDIFRALAQDSSYQNTSVCLSMV